MKNMTPYHNRHLTRTSPVSSMAALGVWRSEATVFVGAVTHGATVTVAVGASVSGDGRAGDGAACVARAAAAAVLRSPAVAVHR